jgi:WD40 repeat protein
MSENTIFISYSHKDEVWKDRLVSQFGVLQEQNLLDLWDDNRISAGAEWYSDIHNAIEKSSIAVLLISANFLTSKFCMHEEVPSFLKLRKEKGLKIIPIIISHCDWEAVDWLKSLQVRPKNGTPLSSRKPSQRDADLASITKEVRSFLASSEATAGSQRITYSSNEFEQLLFWKQEDEIFSIAFSQNKRWLAAGSEEEAILWDISDGKYETREEDTVKFGHSDYVYALAFSPDSKFLVTAGQDKIIRIWNMEKLRLEWKQDENASRRHTDAIYSVIYSPDGKYFITGSYDGSVKMWDAASKNWIKELHVNARVSCIAHAPAGKGPLIVIASHDNSVILWNHQTGSKEELGGDFRHQSSVEAVAFSPNGQWIASCGLDKAVILWDVEHKKSVWRREGNQYHQYLVKSIAISPDGETLASASWDKKINLWDMQGNHYQELPYNASPWHEDWIWTVAFSPDGKILASAGSDGSMMIWKHKS